MPLRRRRLPRHRLPAARPLGVQRQQLQLFHLRAQRLPVHLRPQQGRGVREGGGGHDGGFGFSFFFSSRCLLSLCSVSFLPFSSVSFYNSGAWLWYGGEEIGDISAGRAGRAQERGVEDGDV